MNLNKIFVYITLLIPCLANALVCTGNVNAVETLYTGIVRVSTTSGAPQKAYLCKLDGSWEGVSSDTCKSWLSYAQIAKTSGQKLSVVYSGTPSIECSELPINSASYRPYNVILLD
ncbi:MAG: hypothetical protein ACFHVJ_13845 [Aestuariibacter sp.]